MHTPDRPPQLALVWVDFYNYHLARLRAIHQHIDCVGIELGGGDAASCGLPFRDPDREGLKIISLFPDQDLGQVSPWQLSQTLVQTLQSLAPEHIALCGYHRLENLAALAWAKLTRRPAILMIESKQDDAPRRAAQEWIKSLLVKQFDRYLVGGSAHRSYLQVLGAEDTTIFEGYDVVDNDFFAAAAAAARQTPQLRQQLGLPDRYFMAVGRFIPKKNFARLIAAYQLYRQQSPNGWSLVICGAGPLESELKALAQSLPDVHFPGFYKDKTLASYYGLAHCFIHPSVQEQWGLVVNEAMAAGLPLLVSRTCGCVPNLVHDGINGFTFDPLQPTELAKRMVTIERSDALSQMGVMSQQIIADYAPERFAQGLRAAMGQ